MLGKEVTSRQAQAHISKATQTNFIAKDGWPANFTSIPLTTSGVSLTRQHTKIHLKNQ